MAIIRRQGRDDLYMKFVFQGKQYFLSCKTTNMALAEKREREKRQEIERLAYTPEDQRPLPPAPTLQDFARTPGTDNETDLGGPFWSEYASSEYATRANTMRFLQDRTRALIGYAPLAERRLEKIDEAVLDSYKAYRTGQKMQTSTIRRDFACLKLILKRARRSKLIRVMPDFPELGKERRRGRVVTPEQEQVYMAAADANLRDFVSILIDTAMEPGPTAALTWADVHMGAVGKFTRGFIHDRCTKTDTRERDLPMTARLAGVIKARWLQQGRPERGYVFPADRNGKSHPAALSTFQSAHKRLWKESSVRHPLPIPYFRLYDLRHTCLTRLRNSGADAFDLKQAAGWSSIRMADVYIHVDDESKANAFERLNTHIENISDTSNKSSQSRHA